MGAGLGSASQAGVSAVMGIRMHYLHKSALETSDSVRCNERQSAIMIVRRCMAYLKPGVFDAPLRGYAA